MNKNIVLGLAAIIVVFALVVAYTSKNDVPAGSEGSVSYINQNPAPAPVPAPTPAASPTPTPTPAPIPAAPTVTTSETVFPSNGTAVMTGNVKPNGAATTYWFDYGETESLGSQSSMQAIGSGYALIPTPAYITGLRANTRYFYRLSAKNRFATVNGATYNFQTNTTPPAKGVAPTTATRAATEVSRTSVNINGSVNPNGQSTSYWFEYGLDTSLGSVTALQSAGDGVSSAPVAVSLSGLDPLTKYYFRLNAQNQYGTINGSILNFVTTGPPAPGKPSVDTTAPSKTTTTTTIFSGQVTPNGAETTAWFAYSLDPEMNTVIGKDTPHKTIGATDGVTTLEAAIDSLNPDTKYYYRIIAENQFGKVYGDIVLVQTRR